MTGNAAENAKTGPEASAQAVRAYEDGPNPERPAESRTAPAGATAILRLITHGRNPLKGVPSFRAGRMSRTLRMRPLHQPARQNPQEPAMNITLIGDLTITIAELVAPLDARGAGL